MPADRIDRSSSATTLNKLAFPLFQYHNITRGWACHALIKLGLRPHADFRALINPRGPGGLGQLGLILVSMSLGSAIKQSIYALVCQRNNVPAFAVSLFNLAMNSINVILAFYSPNGPELSPLQWTGVALYGIGITGELVSELQREAFKRKPENKGKLYTGGLFSILRNINYTFYTLWRTGFALAAGSPSGALFNFLLFGYDFAARGVPVLEQWMEGKYGEQWRQYKNRTRWALVPGLI